MSLSVHFESSEARLCFTDLEKPVCSDPNRQTDGLSVSSRLLCDVMRSDTLRSGVVEFLTEILTVLSDQLDSRPPCCLLQSAHIQLLSGTPDSA